jgi:hypothetical protein
MLMPAPGSGSNVAGAAPTRQLVEGRDGRTARRRHGRAGIGEACAGAEPRAPAPAVPGELGLDGPTSRLADGEP